MMVRIQRIAPDWVRATTTALRAVATVLVAGAGIVARGQAPPASPPSSETTLQAPRQVGDLSTRFRFIERYAADAGQGGPRELTQYRVASRDVIRRVTEKPQGTPDRTERTVQVIYSERPSSVNAQGVVTDVVRRYDAFRVTPMPESRPSAPKPLEGLLVWYRNRVGQPPLLMSLDGNRLLAESEYAITLRQIFLPDLSAALPTLPSHVGDRWRLPKSAIQGLLGERPLGGSETIVGTLQDVRKPADGADWSAIIGISGRVNLQGGDTMLNAQLTFTFAAPEEGAASDGALDAHGAITEIRFARSSTGAAPGSNGRLRVTLTWELILQRQITNAGDPLPVPATAPSPNEANSWLTYDDPKGRFNFRHPQDFLPQNLPMLGQDDLVQLADVGNVNSGGGRVITLKLQTPTGNAAEDKNNRDPDFHARQLNDDWARSRQEVLRGPAGWLPEAEWAPFKMQVHRIEAALKPSGGDTRNIQRIFLDHYLVRFGQNESLVIDAMTSQDPPLPFREEVEAILKTFTLGPPRNPTPNALPTAGP